MPQCVQADNHFFVSSFDDFRRTQLLLSWLVHSHLNVACLKILFAGLTTGTISRVVQSLTSGISQLRAHFKRDLAVKPLNLRTAHRHAYVDTLYATNDKLSSQLVYLSLLADSSVRSHVVDYASPNSKWMMCPIICAEKRPVLDAFDFTFVAVDDLYVILCRLLHVILNMDSKQLFDTLIKGKRTTKRRLTVKISLAPQSYRNFEISWVGLICSTVNPEERLTKVGSNGALKKLIDTQVDWTEVVMWMGRTMDKQSTSSW